MLLRVVLTADLIAAGRRGSASGCPAALGVWARLPAARRVVVVPLRGVGRSCWVCRVYLADGGVMVGRLPDAAAAWVGRFTDGAKDLGPITFDLNLEG